MPIFAKKPTSKKSSINKDQLHFLYDAFSEEIETTKKKLEDVEYQLEMFEKTDDLEVERDDIKLMISWLTEEHEDLQKSLLQYN